MAYLFLLFGKSLGAYITISRWFTVYCVNIIKLPSLLFDRIITPTKVDDLFVFLQNSIAYLLRVGKQVFSRVVIQPASSNRMHFTVSSWAQSQLL